MLTRWSVTASTLATRPPTAATGKRRCSARLLAIGSWRRRSTRIRLCLGALRALGVQAFSPDAPSRWWHDPGSSIGRGGRLGRHTVTGPLSGASAVGYHRVAVSGCHSGTGERTMIQLRQTMISLFLWVWRLWGCGQRPYVVHKSTGEL